MTTPEDRFSIPRFTPPVIPAGASSTRQNRSSQRQQRSLSRGLGGVGAFKSLQQGQQQVPPSYGAPSTEIVKEEQKGFFGKVGSMFEAYADLVDPFASMAIAGSWVDMFPGSQHLNPLQKPAMLPVPVKELAQISGLIPSVFNVGKSMMSGTLPMDMLNPESRRSMSAPLLDNWQEEQGRIERTNQIISDRNAGTISFPDAWKALGDIQQERPLMSQILTGSVTDPVGLIPVSPLFKGAKTGYMGLRGITRSRNLGPEFARGGGMTASEKAALGEVDEATGLRKSSYLDEDQLDAELISTPDVAQGVLQSEETSTWIQSNWWNQSGFRRWAANTFAPHSVADLNNPAVKSLEMIRYYMSNTKNASNLAMMWVQRNGNPFKLTGSWRDETGILGSVKGKISFDLRRFGVQRKEGSAMSRLFPETTRPGGARIPLGGERLRDLFGDLFAGRRTLAEATRATGLGGGEAAIKNQMQGARRTALASILNGDSLRRKGILNFWGVEDVVKNEPAGGILSKGHLDTFLRNSDVVKRIDDELAGELPATSDFTRVLIETGQSFPSGAGKTVSRFLDEADRAKVFDDTVDPLIKQQELELGPSSVIETGVLEFAEQRNEIFIEELLQNPELFIMPENIRKYIDDYLNAVQRVVAYAIKVGAIPETDFIGVVPGEYSQMMWKVIQTVKDEKGIPQFKQLGKKYSKPQLFGAGKNMEQMRIRDHVADTLDRNYRGHDIETQMHSTFDALYQMIGEKYVMDTAAPWTKALERRMAKGADVFDEELTNLKNIDPKIKTELRQLLNDSGNMWTEKASLIAGFMRTVGSGFDAGAGLIHGVLMLFTEPARWAKAQKIAFDALLTGEGKSKYYFENLDIVNEMQRNNAISIGDAEYLESMSGGGYLGRGLETLSQGVGPEVTKNATSILGANAQTLASRFANHFDTFLFTSRVEMYKALRGVALEDAAAISTKRARKAGTLDPAKALSRASNDEEDRALRALGEHVNKMFGTLDTANTGLKNSTRKTLGAWFMYAPRYRLASYALMRDVFKKGYRGTMARDRVGNFLTSGLLWYSYTCHMLNQEPKLDPSRGDFMSIKVGGQDLSVGGVWLSTARLFGNLAASALPDGEGRSFMPAGWDGITDNPLGRFFRSQISPLSGSIWNVVSGENFIGEPLDDHFGSFEKIARGVGGNVLPFWMSGFFSHAPLGKGSSFSELTGGDPLSLSDELLQAAPKMLLGGASEFGGLRSYPASRHEKLIETTNDAITMMIDAGDFTVPESKFGVSGNIHWNDLNPIQQGMVKTKYPEIAQRLLQNKEIFTGRSEDELDTYFYNVSSVSNDYKTEIFAATRTFENSDPADADAPARYRQAVKDAGQRVGIRYQDLRDGLTEAATEDLMDQRRRAQSDPDSDLFDLAFFEYIEEVLVADFETENGDFDYRASDKALADFLFKWTGSSDGTLNGENHPVYQYIQQRRSYWWPDKMVEMRLGQEAMSPYWQVSDNILQSLGMPQGIGIYDQYKRASPARQREMEFTHPWIPVLNRATTAARKNLRMINPTLDHFLIRWGYSRSAMHPYNQPQPLVNFIKEPATVNWNPMGG